MTEETDKILSKLRAWCKEKHGRQLEVAKTIGTTPSTVSDWFHDRKEPTAEQILRVLNFLKTKRIRKQEDGEAAAKDMEFK